MAQQKHFDIARYNWRSASEKLVLIGALLLFPLLLSDILVHVTAARPFLAHDEAEHLHVVFALERGERPYLDFIENHPVLPHLLLSGIRQVFHIDSVSGLYRTGLGLVFLHVLGSFVLAWRFLGKARMHRYPGALLIVVAGLATLHGQHNELIWQLRPDWICFFWALLSIWIHYRAHERWIRDGITPGWHQMVFAGAAGGFALAILGKAVLFAIPYAMAVALAFVADFDRAVAVWRGKWKTLLWLNVSFAVSIVAALALMVGFELNATGVDAATYYAANFALNATRHPVSTTDGVTLLDVIRHALGVSLPVMLGAIVVLAVLCIRLARNPDRGPLYLVMGVLLVLPVNGFVPSYTNGGVWPQYYIPTLLAAVWLGALVLAEVLGSVSSPRWDRARSPWFRTGLFLFLAFLLLEWTGERYVDAAMGIQEMRRADGREFLLDGLLPPDLDYLTFSPSRKPVQGKAWGYYFMLAPDHGMWRDVYRLGLGPDPSIHWKQSYEQKPPDVVLIASGKEFAIRAFKLKTEQQIDIAWLGPRLEQDYVCVSSDGVRIQVRNDLATRFQGWKKCSFGLPEGWGEKSL